MLLQVGVRGTRAASGEGQEANSDKSHQVKANIRKCLVEISHDKARIRVFVPCHAVKRPVLLMRSFIRVHIPQWDSVKTGKTVKKTPNLCPDVDG